MNKQNEFKIIEEQTLFYNNQPQLYLMLVRINGQFGVEINSRTAFLGRKMSHRKQAEIMLYRIEQKMKACDIVTATNTLCLAFSMRTVRECMFLVNYLNTEVDFNSIWKMKNTYGIKTNPVVADLIFEDKSFNNTIEIIFPGSVAPWANLKPMINTQIFNLKSIPTTC